LRVGLFVNLEGLLECIRCRRISFAMIQTKLLRHEPDNSCRKYRVGDSEELVGLEDFCPLDPWNGTSPLVVGVGDWDCSHCGLPWQWARAVFDVRAGNGNPIITLRSLRDLRPKQPINLAGIHFVEPWLAELSGLWNDSPEYNYFKGLETWNGCSLTDRREKVAAGFRKWCHEVAAIGQDAQPNMTHKGRDKKDTTQTRKSKSDE
jgi:hypothetical protein